MAAYIEGGWASPSKRKLDGDLEENSEMKRFRAGMAGDYGSGAGYGGALFPAGTPQAAGYVHTEYGDARDPQMAGMPPGDYGRARAKPDNPSPYGVTPNPYNLPDALKPGVKARLEMLFASGKVQRDELDLKILTTLADFNEMQGGEILDNFAEANTASIRNKSAFLAGVIRRCVHFY
jgi:hypothetical protein